MIDPAAAPGLIDSITAWFQTRNWDIYKFSSPVVALFIQFVSRRFKKRLATSYDQKLSNIGVEDPGAREQLLHITKDWDLKASYFATFISAFFSVVAITHAFSAGARFVIVIVAVFVPFLLMYTWVMTAELGTLSLPPASGAARRGKFEAWLLKKNWSEADFYSRVLMGVNILLIVLVFLFMPPKS